MLTPPARQVLEAVTAQFEESDNLSDADARSLMRACELIRLSVLFTGGTIDTSEGVDGSGYTPRHLEVIDALRVFVSSTHALSVLDPDEIEAGELTPLQARDPVTELARLAERSEHLHTGAHGQAGHGSNPWRVAFEALRDDVQATAKAIK